MTCLVGWMAMLMAFGASAHEAPPAFEHMLKPDFPNELFRIGLAGEVWAQFWVNTDGSVVEPRILYSTHPDFAGATLQAINEWKFSAWTQKPGRPERIEILVPLTFSFNPEPHGTKANLSVDLANATCRQFNREVEDLVRHGYRNMSLQSVSLFQMTRTRLIDGYVKGRYSSERLSTGLYDLSQQMKPIAKTCQRKVSRTFVDLLPESTKALLLAGAVSIGAVEQEQAVKP